jgi:hypothetical protein
MRNVFSCALITGAPRSDTAKSRMTFFIVVSPGSPTSDPSLLSRRVVNLSLAHDIALRHDFLFAVELNALGWDTRKAFHVTRNVNIFSIDIFEVG